VLPRRTARSPFGRRRPSSGDFAALPAAATAFDEIH